MTEAVSRKVELTAELPLRRTTRNTPSLLQSGVWLRRTSRSKWAFKEGPQGHLSKKKAEKPHYGYVPAKHLKLKSSYEGKEREI